MSNTVNKPCDVKSPAISEECCYKPRIAPSFAPTIDWDYGRDDEADKRHKDEVIFSLEGNYPVFVKVGKGNGFSFFNYIWVFFDE